MPQGAAGASFYLPPREGLEQAWLMGLCPVPQVEEEKRKKKEEAAKRKQEQEVLHVCVGRGLSQADTGSSTPCPALSASRGLTGYPSASIHQQCPRGDREALGKTAR